MSIQLPPALIANAAQYTNPLVAFSMACARKPKEGLKGIQVQSSYANAPGISFQLGALASGNAAPISQVAAVFIDNSNSLHGVNVVVQGGQIITCAAGAQKLAPILTNVEFPTIYCMLDNGGNGSATDITNLIILNQYLPEFTSNDSVTANLTGLGPFFQPQPIFAAGACFNGFDNLTGGGPDLIVTGQRFFINAMNFSIDIQGTAGGPITYKLGLIDQSGNLWSPFYQRLIEVPSSVSVSEFFNITGLNLDTGNLPAVPNPPVAGIGHLVTGGAVADLIVLDIVYNIFGGQLA